MKIKNKKPVPRLLRIRTTNITLRKAADFFHGMAWAYARKWMNTRDKLDKATAKLAQHGFGPE